MHRCHKPINFQQQQLLQDRVHRVTSCGQVFFGKAVGRISFFGKAVGGKVQAVGTALPFEFRSTNRHWPQGMGVVWGMDACIWQVGPADRRSMYQCPTVHTA